MYQNYFGLTELPFSIAPDPRYLFMSERHREALAHLLYGVNGEGGFVLLTGEVGTGKTTVCRCLLEQIPKNCDVAFVFNPKLTAKELLAAVCREFGIACAEHSNMAYVARLNEYLLAANAQGHKAILIIDEAQNLEVEVLEQMRLLTNLETNRRKLLQIILLGQTELREMLDKPALRQLAQRVTARYHLEPLTRREVAAYVSHRLEVSGARGRLFPAATIPMLSRLSGGIPRLINLLCDRALLGAYIEGESQVSQRILARAAREVFGRDRMRAAERGRFLRKVAATLVLLGGGAAAAYYAQPYAVPALDHAAGLVRGLSLEQQAPGAEAVFIQQEEAR